MEGWKVGTIKSVASIGSGRDYKHLKEGNVPVFGTGGYMTSVNDFLYDGETVCIGRKGTIDTPQYHLGKIWTVDTLFYTHSFENIPPKLLYYIFQSINWKKYNEATGVPSLSKKTIEQINISFPESEIEQYKIINILDKIDQSIEQTEQLIAKYKNIKLGLMYDLLTYGIDENGTIRNPETHSFVEKKGLLVPKEWDVEEIGSGIVKITTGSANTQDKVDDGVYPLFVRSTTIERSSKYIFDGEAVLTSGDGVGVGKIYHYFNGKFNYHQRVYCIYDFEKDRLFGKYFFEYFKSNFYAEISRQSAKTTVDSVRLAMITKMLIKLPLFNEQQKIVSIINQQENLIESEQTNLAKLQKLKQGLMSDLLTGKIRVKI